MPRTERGVEFKAVHAGRSSMKRNDEACWRMQRRSHLPAARANQIR
jgi:hypothetical protein